jgi:hypothetical protein
MKQVFRPGDSDRPRRRLDAAEALELVADALELGFSNSVRAYLKVLGA